MRKIHEYKNEKKFNATVNQVHEEMNKARKSVDRWNVSVKESYSDVYCYDMQSLSEEEIKSLEEKYCRVYDLSRGQDDSVRKGQALTRVRLQDDKGEDYLCEFRKVDWLITNGKLIRNFSFLNTGGIIYTQLKKKRTKEDQSYDYYASYSLKGNELWLRFVNGQDDITFANSGLRQYNCGGRFISEDEDRILVIEHKGGNATLKVELDKSGKIIRHYLSVGECHYIMEGNDIVSAFMGDIEMNIDLELWVSVTYMIDQFALGKMNDDQVWEYVNDVKTKTINAIKGIKGDVILDGLAKRLDIALSMISTKKQVVIDEPSVLAKRKQ